MARSFAKAFYSSRAWQSCRDGYIASVNGLCERCLKQNNVVPGYIVHHKIELNASNINDPNITLSWDNLEYLCHDCHNAEHMTKHNNAADGLVLNDSGELIQTHNI